MMLSFLLDITGSGEVWCEASHWAWMGYGVFP